VESDVEESTLMSNDLMPDALDAAELAGREIMQVYQQHSDIEVTVKDDNSPLTEADRKAHNTIVQKLSQATPDIPILSEESEHFSNEERRNWSAYWLVDPLDGTKEFIQRNGEFTVNIALIVNGHPVAGVVHVPTTGITYYGSEEQGAWKRSQGHAPESIRCRKMSIADSSVTIVASRNHRGDSLEVLLEQLQKHFHSITITSTGSSLKFCMLAEGLADLYPRLGPTSEWDTAAAQAVLQAAGGSVVDTQFRELVYNKKTGLLNPHFFALADSNFPWRDMLGH